MRPGRKETLFTECLLTSLFFFYIPPMGYSIAVPLANDHVRSTITRAFSEMLPFLIGHPCPYHLKYGFTLPSSPLLIAYSGIALFQLPARSPTSLLSINECLMPRVVMVSTCHPCSRPLGSPLVVCPPSPFHYTVQQMLFPTFYTQHS